MSVQMGEPWFAHNLEGQFMSRKRKRVFHTEDDFRLERNGKGLIGKRGSLACYSQDEAYVIIKCDRYMEKFLKIFPPPGVTGWMAEGVDTDRMKNVAAEIEEREAKRGILGRD